MKLSRKLRLLSEDGQSLSVAWWCPGCERMHQAAYDKKTPGPVWEYNRDAEHPTLYPSVEVTWTRLLSTVEEQDMLATLVRQGNLPAMPSEEVHCHVFITQGIIHFLPDSTHHLSGRIIEMPDLPENENDNQTNPCR